MQIADGELLILLGPSGCGKSTTLNIIAGLMAPASGKVIINDEDVTDLPPHQRNIAMVFQSALLYPHLTGRQNILMSLKRSGLGREEIARRVSETATILDIGPLLDKLPSHLSGGERQRVATAKAIVRQPDVFLLDEPLAALDAALRLTLRSELVNLQKRLRTTMVFVTHDQTEAMTMGDRIAVMRAGRLEQIGTPDDVYNRPDTLFVAGFVGSPPMNFFPGEIIGGESPRLRCGAMEGELKARLATVPGNTQVMIAVRPQHLRVREEGGPGTLSATVFALEHLGKESVIILEMPDRTKVRAIVDPGVRAPVGTALQLDFDMEDALFFDPTTGHAIR
ncbi:MAG: ABC transporter ATP-binding protein [Methylobacteriaceae bacterium]|nr:ABC transporter ATP-binding protein [Methylobacteriaceae bacterium]